MAMFHEVFIEEALWRRPDIQEIQSIIDYIVSYFKHCIIEGKPNLPKIKAIKGQGNYKYDFNDKERIPFKLYQAIDENKSHQIERMGLLLGRVLSHEEGEKLHLQEYNFDKYNFDNLKSSSTPWTPPVYEHATADAVDLLSPKSLCKIYREWTPSDSARLRDNADSDLRFRLSQEQKEIVQAQGGEPILLKGAAGCGKTTVSIYRLLELPSGSKALYVTYTPGLREYAKSSFERLSSGLKERADVEFITIESLCFRILPTEDSHKFLPNKKMTFSLFKKLNSVNSSSIDPYFAWSHIQGFLRQTNTINIHPEHSNKQDKAIKSIFNDYKDRLDDDNCKMWDDIALVISALECLKQGDSPRWDHIVVDEVQDLTERHIQLLARLASESAISPDQPASLLMTGDNSQIIHPSMFSWEKLKYTIEHGLNFTGRLACNVRSLNINYRIPSGIMDLANKIQSQNSDDQTHIQTIKQENPSIHLIDIENFHDFRVDILPSTVMIIVPSEEIKEKAQRIFAKNSVFTIYEAKGLENKNIVVYGFFEDPDIARVLRRLQIPTRNSKFIKKHLINLLYVAITRSEERLFIVSNPSSVRKLPSLSKFKFHENDGTELKEILRAPETNPEVYFKWATTNDRQENWEQARVNYLRASELGHPQAKSYADRCQFLMAMSIHDYQEADKWSDQALKANEDSVSGPYFECKGHIALHQGDLKAALKHFKSAQIDHARIIETICGSEIPERYEFSFQYILSIDDEVTRNTLAKWFLKNKSQEGFYFSCDISDVLIEAQSIDLAEDYQKSKVEFIRKQRVNPNLRSIKEVLRFLEEPPYSSSKEAIAHIIRERMEKIENHLRVQGLHTKQKDKDEISELEKAEKNDRQLRNLDYILDDTSNLENQVIQEIVSSKDSQVYQLSLKLSKTTLRSLPSLSSDLLLKIARNSSLNFLRDRNHLEMLILEAYSNNNALLKIIKELIARRGIDLYFLIDLFRDDLFLSDHENVRKNCLKLLKEETLFVFSEISDKLDSLRHDNDSMENKHQKKNKNKINAAFQNLSRLTSVTENNILRLRADNIHAFKNGLGGLRGLPVIGLNSLLSRLYDQ